MICILPQFTVKICDNVGRIVRYNNSVTNKALTEGERWMKFVAITSCPNGIAHTYMAAEKLAKAAERMGHEMKVETQGSIGVENELTREDIEQADGVIIAADKQVDKSRFRGKRVLEVSVTDGIRRPEELIARFERNEVPVYEVVEKLKSVAEAKKSEMRSKILYIEI